MESIYDRSVLCRIRELVSSGKINGFVCYDTDRLARDPRELLAVVGDNERHKVESLFVRLDHKTDDRVGQMILYMKGFASAVEWDAIRDRTMRGRAKVRQQGQWCGVGGVRYGYKWDKGTRTRSADPDTAPIVRRIFATIAAGVSAYKLANLLNDDGIPSPSGCRWRHSTIHKMIREKTYIGVCIERKRMPGEGRYPGGRRKEAKRPESEWVILSDARTEALVDEDLFRRAGEALSANRTLPKKPRSNKAFLLTGHIYCGKCGHRMSPSESNRKLPSGNLNVYRKYGCIGNTRLASTTENCWAVAHAGKADAKAWSLIVDVLLKPGFLEREMARLARDNREDQIRADLKAAQDKRRKVDRQVKSLIDAQIDAAGNKLLSRAIKEKADELDRQATELDGQIESLKSLLVPYRDAEQQAVEFAGVLDRVRELAGNGEIPDEQKRTIVEMLRVKAYATKDDVYIEVPRGVHVNSDTASRSGASARRC